MAIDALKKQWFDIILIFLSGTFLVSAFPSLGMHYFAWIALAPLLLIIKKSGPLRAFLCSMATGLIFFTCLLWWLLKTDGVTPYNFSLGMAAESAYLGLFGFLAWFHHRKLPRWDILTIPAVWVTIEYLRSHMFFLSSPWGILGYSQYTVLPVAGIASFAGVYGVSFLIVVVNEAVAEILGDYLSAPRSQDVRREYIQGNRKIILGVLAGVFILSLFPKSSFTRETDIPKLKGALVQGNIYWNNKYWSDKYKYDAYYREGIFRKYSDLTLHAAAYKPDLILWPSSSVPGRLPFDRGKATLLADMARETGSYLLVGSSGFDKFNQEQRLAKKLSNSAFLYSPEGRMLGRYDKIRLLPFDEYLPLRGYIKWPSWIASDMIDSFPGKEMTIFNMDKAKFAVLICWENMFPDQFREMSAKGVDFMVSMTNEGFTAMPAAHYLMLATNVLRAVENHVSVLRISSTGVSCVIGPDGRIIDRVKGRGMNDVNVEGYLVSGIPLTSERSFYNRYGDWFVYMLLVMLGTLHVQHGVRRWHNKYSGRNNS